LGAERVQASEKTGKNLQGFGAGRAPSLVSPGFAVLCFFAFLPLLAPDPVFGQKSSGTPGQSLSARVAEQKKLIQAQEQLILEQSAFADSQAARIDSLVTRIDELKSELVAMLQRLETLEAEADIPPWESELEARLKAIEAKAEKSPELPPDIVSAGDFPGSIRIPGANAAVKFGGRIRTAAVFTLNPMGTDDRFLTNSIPVGTQTLSGEAKRTSISARASRFNVEFRTPAGKTQVRGFIEGDFAGAGNALRLRHAYAQFYGFIVGQTWSTFSDPAANHQDLDFEGVSSENVIRQPQIRYWWRVKEVARAAFAIETPSVSLTGGVGVNLVPDTIGRIIWEDGKGKHVQIAGVLRQIRGEATPGDVRSDLAGGGSVSGVFPFQWRELEDRVIFQINGGTGIARYINDLNSLGGQDAVFDSTTGDLHALPAYGWYVAYEHAWKSWGVGREMKLRSTVLWSFVDVDNFEFQAPDAYNYTHRLAVNAIFSPAERAEVGVEYIYGQRTNKDGNHGSANQIQLVMLFGF
jgi:hypothetical protein